ncbi:MAG: sensor histidine kinase [Gemmatimonadaceae bacterium]
MATALSTPDSPYSREAADSSDSRGRVTVVLAVLVGAAVLGLIDASQVQYDRALRGAPITWGHALIHGLPRWYSWALLAPVVLLIARRVDRARLNMSRTLLIHAAAGAICALVQVSLFSIASTVLHGGADPLAHLRPAFVKYLGMTYLGAMVTYALLVFGWYAWDVHRRFRERERQAAQLELQASELKALAAEARLRQLQSQLQPHFLFNTLHALSSLVLKGEGTTAIRMTTRLSELLRRSLRAADATEITLGEELQLLDDYLAIQRMRFGDRLEVRMQIDHAARKALVPPLLLQPLVENAVRHAIEVDPGGSRIEIIVAASAGRLRMTVRDDGPGLRTAREPAGEAGIGLTNTLARLEATYGSAAELTLESVASGGAEATITVPLREAPGKPASTTPILNPAKPGLA